MNEKLLGNRYQIRDKIGEGGMGTVYRCLDTCTNEHLAIKVLSASTVSAESAGQRFLKEVQLLQCLKHPNVVSILDCGEHDGTPYMVTELFCDDEGNPFTLARLQASSTGHRLSVDHLISVFSSLLRGIAYLHGQGILHRDIKPENVLLRKNEDGSISAILADFGLVTLTADDTMRQRFEQSLSLSIQGGGDRDRAMIGTYSYMSPEQRNGKNLDAGSDVYSFGLMLYRMATGYQRLNPELPSDVNPSIPTWIDDLVERAVETLPKDRWRDANEIIETFSDHLPARQLPPPALTDSQAANGNASFPESAPHNQNPTRKQFWPAVATIMLLLAVTGGSLRLLRKKQNRVHITEDQSTPAAPRPLETPESPLKRQPPAQEPEDNVAVTDVPFDVSAAEKSLGLAPNPNKPQTPLLTSDTEVADPGTPKPAEIASKEIEQPLPQPKNPIEKAAYEYLHRQGKSEVAKALNVLKQHPSDSLSALLKVAEPGKEHARRIATFITFDKENLHNILYEIAADPGHKNWDTGIWTLGALNNLKSLQTLFQVFTTHIQSEERWSIVVKSAYQRSAQVQFYDSTDEKSPMISEFKARVKGIGESIAFSFENPNNPLCSTNPDTVWTALKKLQANGKFTDDDKEILSTACCHLYLPLEFRKEIFAFLMKTEAPQIAVPDRFWSALRQSHACEPHFLGIACNFLQPDQLQRSIGILCQEIGQHSLPLLKTTTLQLLTSYIHKPEYVYSIIEHSTAHGGWPSIQDIETFSGCNDKCLELLANAKNIRVRLCGAYLASKKNGYMSANDRKTFKFALRSSYAKNINSALRYLTKLNTLASPFLKEAKQHLCSPNEQTRALAQEVTQEATNDRPKFLSRLPEICIPGQRKPEHDDLIRDLVNFAKPSNAIPVLVGELASTRQSRSSAMLLISILLQHGTNAAIEAAQTLPGVLRNGNATGAARLALLMGAVDKPQPFCLSELHTLAKNQHFFQQICAWFALARMKESPAAEDRLEMLGRLVQPDTADMELLVYALKQIKGQDYELQEDQIWIQKQFDIFQQAYKGNLEANRAEVVRNLSFKNPRLLLRCLTFAVDDQNPYVQMEVLKHLIGFHTTDSNELLNKASKMGSSNRLFAHLYTIGGSAPVIDGRWFPLEIFYTPSDLPAIGPQKVDSYIDKLYPYADYIAYERDPALRDLFLIAYARMSNFQKELAIQRLVAAYINYSYSKKFSYASRHQSLFTMLAPFGPAIRPELEKQLDSFQELRGSAKERAVEAINRLLRAIERTLKRDTSTRRR